MAKTKKKTAKKKAKKKTRKISKDFERRLKAEKDERKKAQIQALANLKSDYADTIRLQGEFKDSMTTAEKLENFRERIEATEDMILELYRNLSAR